MTTHEKALLTYEALMKRKEAKKEQERQKRQDASSTGWNGYTRFVVREHKKYYRDR